MGKAHCWEDYRDEEGNGYSCMRINGHEGKHEFVKDKDIGVKFV